MFDYCSLIQKNCSFDAKRGELTYCGLHKGYTLAENRVDYNRVCTKEKLKTRRELCTTEKRKTVKRNNGKN